MLALCDTLRMSFDHEFFAPGEDHFTGPSVTEALIVDAQARLGYELPSSYVELLRVQNGGKPNNRIFHTGFPTSWAPDHFEILAIRGIGGPWGIDTPGGLSSASLISEWGYPPIGVVICEMPSGGHDTVMLSYEDPRNEPAVVHVDEDRQPKLVATTFAEFVDQLVNEAERA